MAHRGTGVHCPTCVPLVASLSITQPGTTFLACINHPNRLTTALLAPPPTACLQWIRPVDLVIPPRIQAHTEGRIPHPVHVDHQRRRGESGQCGGLPGMCLLLGGTHSCVLDP